MNRSEAIRHALTISRDRANRSPDDRLQACSRAVADFHAVHRREPNSLRAEAAAHRVIITAAEEQRWRERRELDRAEARTAAAVTAARARGGRAALAHMDGLDRRAVRAWALANGHDISPTGSVVPRAVADAYRAAHA